MNYRVFCILIFLLNIAQVMRGQNANIQGGYPSGSWNEAGLSFIMPDQSAIPNQETCLSGNPGPMMNPGMNEGSAPVYYPAQFNDPGQFNWQNNPNDPGEVQNRGSFFHRKKENKKNALPLVNYDQWEEYDVQEWKWQLLPAGLIYPSYLAGRKESRLGAVYTHEEDYGWIWDITLGGRVPIIRYGSGNAVQPEGFQIDLEGAALLRLDFEKQRDLAATDYRAGIPLTYGTKHWQYKLAYYHISSHLGDNYIQDRYRIPPVNYVRDEILFGIAWRPINSVRLYGEAGWAFHRGKTTDPWEFQFGAEYSHPYMQTRNPWKGSPFAAINAHLFEEIDFKGYLNTQAGWQWRGPTNNLFRIGLEFFTGYDEQFQF
ncbi:MAG: DUF1207 domain-containing protein, partial [Planctomycetia bacterium]|nr:DUF1207 domain-containing protein [Planctomycetia bacterium]